MKYVTTIKDQNQPTSNNAVHRESARIKWYWAYYIWAFSLFVSATLLVTIRLAANRSNFRTLVSRLEIKVHPNRIENIKRYCRVPWSYHNWLCDSYLLIYRILYSFDGKGSLIWTPRRYPGSLAWNADFLRRTSKVSWRI